MERLSKEDKWRLVKLFAVMLVVTAVIFTVYCLLTLLVTQTAFRRGLDNFFGGGT